MKLISLWEPWATLMAIGAKQIETRSWSTPYRGWLAIHASKGGLPQRDLRAVMAGPEFMAALGIKGMPPASIAKPKFPFGCIIAVVRLLDCCPTETRGCLSGVFTDYPELDTPQERAFGDFGRGRWAWVTEDLFRLQEPIPFKAHQGLVDLPPAALAELRKQWRFGDE